MKVITLLALLCFAMIAPRVESEEDIDVSSEGGLPADIALAKDKVDADIRRDASTTEDDRNVKDEIYIRSDHYSTKPSSSPPRMPQPKYPGTPQQYYISSPSSCYASRPKSSYSTRMPIYSTLVPASFHRSVWQSRPSSYTRKASAWSPAARSFLKPSLYSAPSNSVPAGTIAPYSSSPSYTSPDAALFYGASASNSRDSIFEEKPLSSDAFSLHSRTGSYEAPVEEESPLHLSATTTVPSCSSSHLVVGSPYLMGPTSALSQSAAGPAHVTSTESSLYGTPPSLVAPATSHLKSSSNSAQDDLSPSQSRANSFNPAMYFTPSTYTSPVQYFPRSSTSISPSYLKRLYSQSLVAPTKNRVPAGNYLSLTSSGESSYNDEPAASYDIDVRSTYAPNTCPSKYLLSCRSKLRPRVLCSSRFQYK